jgi:hypothetical protein
VPGAPNTGLFLWFRVSVLRRILPFHPLEKCGFINQDALPSPADYAVKSVRMPVKDKVA